MEKALADYTRLIEQLPGAPVEQVAQALDKRGVASSQQGETEKELADYTRVIEQLPEAPVEQVAKALYNRGVTWGREGRYGKGTGRLHPSDRAIAGGTGGAGGPGAQQPRRRVGPAGRYGKGASRLHTSDRAIAGGVGRAGGPGIRQPGMAEIPEARVRWFSSRYRSRIKQRPALDFAAFNLGLALLTSGRDADALAAYRAAGERFPSQSRR